MHVFLPLSSLRRLIGMPMDRLLNHVVPLDAVLGAAAAYFSHSMADAPTLDVRIALLDAALIRRFGETPALPRAQLHALALLRDRPDLAIADVAHAVGWSHKHLASRVHDAVGLGPRSWRRLIRFERFTQRLTNPAAPAWADLAQDAGYCDQPHMIREFREFAGLTPSEHRSRSLPDGGGLIEN